MFPEIISPQIAALILQATLDTLQMVAVAAGLGTVLGLPLGVFLATSKRGELFRGLSSTRCSDAGQRHALDPFHHPRGGDHPFTRLIAGTSIGTQAAIVPLTVAATPFIARLIEGAIREVDQGLVEAARAMGATPLQIVRKVLVPEALPAIALGLTLAIVSLIGFSAMVGAVGGGGWAISASATATSASCPRSWPPSSPSSSSWSRPSRRSATISPAGSTSACVTPEPHHSTRLQPSS